MRTLFGMALTATAAVLAFMAPAQAKEAFPRWYVGMAGDVSFQQDSDWGNREVSFEQPSYGMSAALGYRPTSVRNARIELEGVYNYADISSIGGISANGELRTRAAMLNAFYDFAVTDRFRPYVGFGAGLARVTLDDGLDTRGKYVPAWQARLGLAYTPEIMYNVVDLTFGYRFFNAADAEIAGSDISVFNHSIEVGARLNF